MPTAEESLASMMAKLPETTGKSLDEWLKIVASTGLAKHGEIVKHLKAGYGKKEEVGAELAGWLKRAYDEAS